MYSILGDGIALANLSLSMYRQTGGNGWAAVGRSVLYGNWSQDFLSSVVLKLSFLYMPAFPRCCKHRAKKERMMVIQKSITRDAIN